jgi:dTDP-4-dehydrorhamnose 3,5-epimerase
MPFSFKSLAIPDVILIEPRAFTDERGYFLESFKSSDFSFNHVATHFVQDNLSFSKQNVLRGLHFQKKPKEQGKLVSVIKGCVLDVAVDLRKESPTFLKWVSVELDDSRHSMLYIPEGFAHGFLALTKEVFLLYKCTHEYDPKFDSGIRWNDPNIGIEWPVKNPVVSEKDQHLPYYESLNLQ